MKRTENMNTERNGVLKGTSKLSFEQIGLYILIFAGCALAMLVNLNMEGVGLWALTQGTDSERNLLLTTALVVILCLMAVVLLIRAFALKRAEMKQENSNGLKTTYIHNRKK
ncbi:MAG: hypothetical protein LUG61_02925 [Lachnospiraceae bacterium]|nr:hypothetical protein [Lachnospiraceae bacterium]